MTEEFFTESPQGIDAIFNGQANRSSVFGYPLSDNISLLRISGDHLNDTSNGSVGVFSQRLSVDISLQSIAALSHFPCCQDVDKDLAELQLGEAIFLTSREQ